MMLYFCLVTILSIVTLSGCDPFNPPCEATIIKVDNLNADLVRVTSTSEDINGYTHYDIENFPYGSLVARYDSIAFNISYDMISFFIQENTVLPFMMNSAYACSPGPFYESISSINIKSNEDYDNLHQSGTSLNDIFVFSDGPDFIYSIDEYIESVYYYPILMMMSIAPEFERTHTFTIELTFEDGRVLSQQLDPVRVKL